MEIKIYNIPELMRQTFNSAVDEETGEIRQDVIEEFTRMSEEKILGALAYAKECKAKAKAIREHIRDRQAVAQSLERRAKWFEDRSVESMQAIGVTKLSDAQLSASISQRESIDWSELDDQSALEKLAQENKDWVRTELSINKEVLGKVIKEQGIPADLKELVSVKQTNVLRVR